MELGKLERVDLRAAWLSEPADFTPWLASEGNLSLLADALGTELELVSTEHGVGPFRADLVCRDTIDEHLVLIENQLARTDHSHLGQLMTYAAGLDTATIVWIAAQFTEEHRAALDWLNRITEERFRFFGMEVELWRIGTSPAAPRFNIISKPNDWTKHAARRIERDDRPSSEREAALYEYWAELRVLAERLGSNLRFAEPWARTWFPVGIGRSGAQLTMLLRPRERKIVASVFLRRKPWFLRLEDQKPSIQDEFGGPLSWEALPNRKGARIATYLEPVDPFDRTTWEEQHRWLLQNLERLDKVFRSRVRALPSLRDDDLEAEDYGTT